MKPRHEARTPESDPPHYRKRRKRKPHRLFPVLVFGVIVLMVIRTRVPVVDDWVTRTFTPEKWEALNNCMTSVKAKTPNPEFSRVLEHGYVVPTESGYLVNSVEIGTMGDRSGEDILQFSCYLDSNRKVVRVDQNL